MCCTSKASRDRFLACGSTGVHPEQVNDLSSLRDIHCSLYGIYLNDFNFVNRCSFQPSCPVEPPKNFESQNSPESSENSEEDEISSEENESIDTRYKTILGIKKPNYDSPFDFLRMFKSIAKDDSKLLSP